MGNVIVLSQAKFKTNSNLWEIVDVDGEGVLQVVGNRKVDHVGGKIALFDEPRSNYSMSADMRFLGHHLLEGSGGWFGFVVRAHDELNFELVWFMPLEKNEEGEVTTWVRVIRSADDGTWTGFVTLQVRFARVETSDWRIAAILMYGES